MLGAANDLGHIQGECTIRSMSAAVWMEPTMAPKSPATGACSAYSTTAFFTARLLIVVIRWWSEITCSASTRLGCGNGAGARCIATPVSPLI